MNKYLTLDPRQESRGAEMEKLRSAALRSTVIGIEVTIPEFAALCSINIDPQHTGDIAQAAIEAALELPLPEGPLVFVTPRPDVDSVGAMALLTLRIAEQSDPQGIFAPLDGDQNGWHSMDSAQKFMDRVGSIARADKHGRGDWPGLCQFPVIGDIPEIQKFSGMPAGLAGIVSDWKISLGERVHRMMDWLVTGTCEGLEEAQALAQAEYDQAILATQVFGVYRPGDMGPGDPGGRYEAAFIPNETRGALPPLASVESTHRGGLGLGYCVAPVVVATNEKFRLGKDVIGIKHTVAQYGPGYCDIEGAKAALNDADPSAYYYVESGIEGATFNTLAEAKAFVATQQKKLEIKVDGWGGSPTIIGSPQGRESGLTHQEVCEIVGKFIS